MNSKDEAVYEKITELETDNIELREILKQECFKNEKLTAMVDLLKKFLKKNYKLLVIKILVR